MAESEPKTWNNATAIWKQIFKVYLSGTSTHFDDRFKLIEKRIYIKDNKIFSICLDALKHIFDNHSRVSDRPVFGEHTSPEDWRPKTTQEGDGCYKKAFDFIIEYISERKIDDHRKSKLKDLLIEEVWSLLEFGFFDNLRAQLKAEKINDEQRIKLIQNLENIFHLNSKDEKIKKEFIDELSNWIQKLRPKDNINVILKEVTGIEPWHSSEVGREEEWEKDLRQITKECINNPDIVKNNIEWLYSHNAKSAFNLGKYLGEADRKGILLDLILDSCKKYKSTPLTTEYIESIALKHHSSLILQINTFLDEIQDTNPKLAFELGVSGWRKTKSLERAIHLVENDLLSVAEMAHFSFYEELNEITELDVTKILEVIKSCLKKDPTEATNVFLNFLGRLLSHGSTNKKKRVNLLDNETIRNVSWELIENCYTGGQKNVHYWEIIMRNLINYDTHKSIEIIIQIISSDSLYFSGSSYKILSEIKKSDPELVMSKIGELLLDKSKKLNLLIDTNKKTIFMNLPSEVVINWIDNHGVDAARIASFLLPLPNIDSQKNAVIPELTEKVLTKYGSDKKVFDNFCAGSHDIQCYTGDIAKMKENKAEELKPLLNHRLDFIRKWANYMIDSAMHEANWHRQQDEEFFLELE